VKCGALLVNSVLRNEQQKQFFDRMKTGEISTLDTAGFFCALRSPELTFPQRKQKRSRSSFPATTKTIPGIVSSDDKTIPGIVPSYEQKRESDSLSSDVSYFNPMAANPFTAPVCDECFAYVFSL
jgi:hypothetical protein